MLERTKKKSFLEDILCEDINYITKGDIEITSTRVNAEKSKLASLDDNFHSPNEGNMTRKTRTRRPRVQVIQSGYCAICSVPYNNVEDHIQSKKHQKLIGEDANYIALNGYVHPDVSIESLLSLNGIEAIGLEHDYSPKLKRRNMPRTRASSVLSDVIKSSPLSPTGSDYVGHQLRSRKNINYMTPPLEDESVLDKPDFDPVQQNEYKEYRELRSSTRALAKLTSYSTNEQEVWGSGRPKRRCIGKSKRTSADDRLVLDNKTYYRVEVMSSKLRSSDRTREKEATRALKSKSKESNEEEAVVEAETVNTRTRIVETQNNSSSDVEDCKSPKVKMEDEASMDSISSEAKSKRRRRTHAEAFIMDNQKYYKFEPPGSSSCRLRYHGSYLSPIPLVSPKPESCSASTDVEMKEESEDYKKEKQKVNLSKYRFSFETVPKQESWYQAFQRQDKGEERYNFSSADYWNEFILPYQMTRMKPLDPKICLSTYKELIKNFRESSYEPTCSNHERSVNESVNAPVELDIQDEDSKISSISVSSVSLMEEPLLSDRTRAKKNMNCTDGKNPRKSPRQHASTLAILSSLIHQRKRRSKTQDQDNSSTNLPAIPEEVHEEPTKSTNLTVNSPRKAKKPDYISIASKIDEILDVELEDSYKEGLEVQVFDKSLLDFKESRIRITEILQLYEDAKTRETESSCRRFFNGSPGRKPGRRKKNKTGWPNKIRRRKILKESEGDDSTVESASVNQESENDDVESTNSHNNGPNGRRSNKRKVNMTGWPSKVNRRRRRKIPQDNDIGIRKKSRGNVAKKPLKRKKNKTGWPNKKRKVIKARGDNDSSQDSQSPTEASDNGEDCADSINNDLSESDKLLGDVNTVENCDSGNRVENTEFNNKVLKSKLTNQSDMQPFVYVKKLECSKLAGNKVLSSPRRTSRRQRHIPGSPKSPRILRRPRGRWYRER